MIEGLKVLLRGGVAVSSAEELFTVERSLPNSHAAAVLGSARGSGAALWFGAAPQDLQPLLLAMLVARVIEPASKLATQRQVHDDTASSSLGRVLGVGQSSADDLCRALDWLHEAQSAIERRLARQHLVGATLVLYDLTSTWLTARGHSRDGKRDDPQIVYGLVCTSEGCPIAVEVLSRCADDGLPLHSLRTLLKDLGTLAYNITHTQASPNTRIVLTTRPTPSQAKAFGLLALNPACTQSPPIPRTKSSSGTSNYVSAASKFGLEHRRLRWCSKQPCSWHVGGRSLRHKVYLYLQCA